MYVLTKEKLKQNRITRNKRKERKWDRKEKESRERERKKMENKSLVTLDTQLDILVDKRDQDGPNLGHSNRYTIQR